MPDVEIKKRRDYYEKPDSLGSFPDDDAVGSN